MVEPGGGDVSITLTIKGATMRVLDSDRDTGRGVIRLDSGTMEALGASAGDILEVLGRRRTVARCLPLGDQTVDSSPVTADGPKHPVDGGAARIDHVTRENARVSEGDIVALRKVNALPANYAEVVSLADPPSVDARYIELALNGLPVSPGDVVMIPQAELSGKERYFQVVSLEPPTEQAVLMVSTIFRIVRRAASETAAI